MTVTGLTEEQCRLLERHIHKHMTPKLGRQIEADLSASSGEPWVCVVYRFAPATNEVRVLPLSMWKERLADGAGNEWVRLASVRAFSPEIRPEDERRMRKEIRPEDERRMRKEMELRFGKYGRRFRWF